MTDLLEFDPNDSGEIPRPVGEDRTVVIRFDTGERTQRIDPRLIQAPSFDAIPRKVVDIDDTVVYHLPPSIAVIPDPDTVTLTLLGTLTATPDGDLRPAAPGPFPVPLPPTPPPAPKPSGYVGRHRDPWDRVAVEGERTWGRLVEAAKPGGEPRRLRVQVGVSAFIALACAVTVAVLRVFW